MATSVLKAKTFPGVSCRGRTMGQGRNPGQARGPFGRAGTQGCIKLLDFPLSSIGWRRGLGRGGAFLLVSPLLGPLPTRSSRGEDGEVDAALGHRPSDFALLANAFGVAPWWSRAVSP